ncbi:MAG: VOC family protein [Thermomicrobiaceae bacterium]|nr:VOC family protein [Thermomicrobiaceae bacterium]
MANHPIVHVEFPASDPESAGRFYAELFGWQITTDPEMGYVMFAPGSGPEGGFPPADGGMNAPGRVLVYVGTDDVDASLAKAESLGGRVVVRKTEIPGVGWFGVFTDPTGNAVGLFSALGGARA